MIKLGETVKFKKEWMDAGDENIQFIAIDDEFKGRVTVEAQVDLPLKPTQVVKTEWLV